MEPTTDLAVLREWIGRSESLSATIRVGPANFMEMTLDRDPALRPGDALPPLWHWLYFLQSAKLGELGRDGHPARGGFLPPVALPRRMWAGGRFGFLAPLPIGASATKTSTIKDVALKQGRSGALCFVTVRHEVSTGAGPALWEEHDIVYREDPGPGDKSPSPPAASTGWDVTETVTPSEVMLFRYSALTFNGHRIHYDRDYARDVEGHEGLVVHGPLIATLLADLALQFTPGRALKGFAFRAVSPCFDDQPITLNMKSAGSSVMLAAARTDGGLAMTATAEF